MMFKKKKQDELKYIMKVDIGEELRKDSIAHKIKNYFEVGTIQNSMLFKYDEKKDEVLVSKEILIYLLSLENDIEKLKSYKMKIVDKIELFK